jgi:hypothetical protein
MRGPLKTGLLLLSLVVVAVGCFSAQANVFRFLPLEEMTEISDLIVVGKVVDVRSGRDEVGARIRTRVTMSVDKALHGSVEGETISFDLPGGFAPDEHLRQVIPGVPKFVVGEEAIIFLSGDSSLFCPVTGWAQGKFSVVSDESTGGRIVLDRYGKCRQYRGGRASAAAPAGAQGEENLTLEEFTSILDEIRSKGLSEKSDSRQEAVSASPASEWVLAGFEYSGYKWPDEEIPVKYYVYVGLAPPDSIATSTYVEAVRAAFQKWEDVPSSYMAFLYGGQTTAYSPNLNRTDGRNTVGWTDERLGPGALAVTSYWFPDGDYIVEFDTALKRTITGGSHWSVQTPTPSTAYDLHSVILHEAGHTLSLDHVDDPSQVMYPYISAGEMRRELGQGDIDGVTFIYPKPGDLSVSEVLGPSSALEHEAIELSATICNVGGQHASNSQLDFWLCLSPTISTEATLLGIAAVPALDQGAEYDARVLVVVPPVTEERDYYVCAMADAGEVIAEASEDNNTACYFPFKVWFDSDADGLPNWWEEEMSLNPYDAAGEEGSEGDPDGDGLLNNKEYQVGANPHLADSDGDGQNDSDEVAAGTDPTDAASLFHITQIAAAGAGGDRWVTIAWTTVSGKQYQVYYQDEPGTPWTPLGPLYEGDGSVIGHDDLEGWAFPSRMYRVGLE